MFNTKRIARLEGRVNRLEEALALVMLKKVQEKFGSLNKKPKAKYGFKKNGQPKHRPGPRKLQKTPCPICSRVFIGAVGVAAHKRHVHNG